jgi:hypothetical protein
MNSRIPEIMNYYFHEKKKTDIHEIMKKRDLKA